MPKSVEEAREDLMEIWTSGRTSWHAANDALQDLVDAVRNDDLCTLVAAIECDPEIGRDALLIKIHEQVPSE